MHSCTCGRRYGDWRDFVRLGGRIDGTNSWGPDSHWWYYSEQTVLRGVRRFVRCPGKCRRHAWHVNAQRFGSGP